MNKDAFATWEVLGCAAVDSGQLLLIDPARLSQWEQREFEDVRIYEHATTGQTLQYGVDFGHYTDKLPQYNGLDMNQLVASGEWEMQPVDPGAGLSYNTVSHTTLNAGRGGQIDLGVAFSTGFGDGLYPVKVRRCDDGRIMQVLIDFES